MARFVTTEPLARYDRFSIALHWLTAITVIGLFGLGFWMVDLDYYDAWYRRAPDLHRSIGLSLAMLFVARIGWMFWRERPRPLTTHGALERRIARVVHALLLVLLAVMFSSGYLISTAKGQGIDVFGLIEVPAILTSDENLEDLAGIVHEWTAYSLVAIAALHAAAAVKHHFMDRDATLTRMLGRAPEEERT